MRMSRCPEENAHMHRLSTKKHAPLKDSLTDLSAAQTLEKHEEMIEDSEASDDPSTTLK